MTSAIATAAPEGDSSDGDPMQQQPDMPPTPPPPIADEIKDREGTIERLMRSFVSYRDDDRRKTKLNQWRAVYRAYHGFNPNRPEPYGLTYFIRETFRQIEVLKPNIVEQFMSGDEWFRYMPEHPGEEDAKAAATRIVHKQLRSARSGICTETEMMKWYETAVFYGTSYITTGWAEFRYTRRKPMLQHLEEDLSKTWYDRETEEIMAGCPYGEHLMPWEVYSHPEVEDPRMSPHVFVQRLVSPSDLKTLIHEGWIDADEVQDCANQSDQSPLPHSSDMDVEFNRPNYGNMYNVEIDSDPEGDGLHEILTCWDSHGWEYVILDRQFLIRAQRLEGGKIPIHCLRNYPQPKEHWGIPEAVVILEEQRLLNDFTSAWVASVKFSVTPMMEIEGSPAVKEYKDSTFRPGGYVKVSKSGMIKPLIVPDSSEKFIENANYLRSNMQMGTGITPELSGTGSESGTATVHVHMEQAANKRIQHKVRWFSPTVRDFYQDMYDLNATYLSEEVRTQVEGDDGTTSFVSRGPDVFANEVEIQLSDVSQATPEERNTALQEFQLFNNDPLTDQVALRKRYWTKSGEKKPGRLITNPATAAPDALGENRDWMGLGYVGDPNPQDDHQTHLQIHMLALHAHAQGAPQHALASMVKHIQYHQAYMNFQQKQQAQQQMTQGPGQAQGQPPQQQGQPQQEANNRTEKTFSNGMTGAARQGQMPQRGGPQQ